MDTQPRFRDFDFGYSAAESEAKYNKELLKGGFVDLNGESTELLNSHKFLVLGGKGTGKSALAQHLKLSQQPDAFVNIVELTHNYYNELIAIVKGERTQVPKAWSWLLLVSMFASFKDAGEDLASNSELAIFQRLLDSVGLLPSGPTDIEELIHTSRRKATGQNLQQVYRVELNSGLTAKATQGSASPAPDIQLSVLVAKLETALIHFESKFSHLIIIDNTDKIRDIDQNLDRASLFSLVDLIEQSQRINDLFRASGVKAKIIVLCRTELFDRLPGPTMNRIRQDYGVTLNWYSSDADACPLLRVANQRAKLQCGHDIDIFATYFPSEVARLKEPSTILADLPNKGLSINPASTKEYLLDRTRYTPRDFVTLLKSIQTFSPETTVSMSGIASGIRLYASTHFVPEIRDELDGYLLPDEKDSLLAAFGKIRNRVFRIDGLRKRIPDRFHNRLPAMLTDLFNCGVIGNWEDPESPALRTYRYRFPDCHLDLEGKMVLHPAFAMAVNARPAKDQAIPEDLQRLSAGKIKQVGTPAIPGVIASNDGWLFRYQTNDVVGDPRNRLCEGDTVCFEPPQFEVLKGRKRGYAPYPNVRGVRVLPPDAVRFIADRDRGNLQH